jgi:chromosome segregation ATPase
MSVLDGPGDETQSLLATSLELNLRLESKLREITADAMGLAERVDDAEAEVERVRGIVERMKAEEEQGVRDYLDLRDVADRAISDRGRAEIRSSALLEEIGRLQSRAERHRTYRLLVDGFARDTMTPAAYETLCGFAEILEEP